MKKKDWQKFWELTDEDMEKLETLLRIFKGKIVSIKKKVDKEQSQYILSMLGGFMRHPEVEKYLKETCRKAGQSKSKKKIKSCLKNLEKAWARTRALKKERQDGQ